MTSENAALAVATLLLVAACDESDSRAADAGTMDGSAATACASPLNPTRDGQGNGCPCVGGWSRDGWCVNGSAIVCFAGRADKWMFGADGDCSPRADEALAEACAERRGVRVEFARTCPSGFGRLYPTFAPTPDGGLRQACCHPIESTAERCTETGLRVLAAAPQTDLLDTACSNGGALRGFILDAGQPSVCCTSP